MYTSNEKLVAATVVFSLSSLLLAGCVLPKRVEDTGLPPLEAPPHRPMTTIGVATSDYRKPRDPTDFVCTLGVSRVGWQTEQGAAQMPSMTACVISDHNNEPILNQMLVSICAHEEGGYVLMQADKKAMEATRTVWNNLDDPELTARMNILSQTYVDVRSNPNAKVDGVKCARWIDVSFGSDAIDSTEKRWFEFLEEYPPK